MAGSDYEYTLEIYNTESRLINQSRLTPDWLPAIEAARFQSMRDGRSDGPTERIEPVWHSVHGQPHLSGFCAVVDGGDGVETSVEFSITYFLTSAHEVAQTLVRSGDLAEGAQFVYAVNAFPVSRPQADEANGGGMAVERLALPSIQRRRPIGDLTTRVRESAGAGDQPFPVFVPRSVLDQAGEIKDAAREVETGGILIGFLWQDPDSREPFGEVTAFLPARHTVAGSTKLTFTADTWADLRATIDLRGTGENFIGWVHTHPARFWCTCLDPQKLITCPFARDFFSRDDRLLHRTVFHKAHHVAVVLGDRYTAEGWGTTISAYGWRGGIIAAREVYVMDPLPDPTPR